MMRKTNIVLFGILFLTGCNGFDTPKTETILLALDGSGSSVPWRPSISDRVVDALATDGQYRTIKVQPILYARETLELNATDSTRKRLQETLEEWRRTPVRGKGTHLGAALQRIREHIEQGPKRAAYCIAISSDSGFEDRPEEEAKKLAMDSRVRQIAFIGAEPDGTDKLGRLRKITQLFGDRAFIIPRQPSSELENFRASFTKNLWKETR